MIESSCASYLAWFSQKKAKDTNKIQKSFADFASSYLIWKVTKRTKRM